MYKHHNITMREQKYSGGMAMLFDWNARVLDLAPNYFALYLSPVPFHTGGF
jgi:hypothetical protein